MLYTFSMLVVVMIGFGTIVWRIRSAEEAEQHEENDGNVGDDIRRGEGSYAYTYRGNDDHRGGGHMQYNGMQPVKVYNRR